MGPFALLLLLFPVAALLLHLLTPDGGDGGGGGGVGVGLVGNNLLTPIIYLPHPFVICCYIYCRYITHLMEEGWAGVVTVFTLLLFIYHLTIYFLLSFVVVFVQVLCDVIWPHHSPPHIIIIVCYIFHKHIPGMFPVPHPSYHYLLICYLHLRLFPSFLTFVIYSPTIYFSSFWDLCSLHILFYICRWIHICSFVVVVGGWWWVCRPFVAQISLPSYILFIHDCPLIALPTWHSHLTFYPPLSSTFFPYTFDLSFPSYLYITHLLLLLLVVVGDSYICSLLPIDHLPHIYMGVGPHISRAWSWSFTWYIYFLRSHICYYSGIRATMRWCVWHYLFPICPLLVAPRKWKSGSPHYPHCIIYYLPLSYYYYYWCLVMSGNSEARILILLVSFILIFVVIICCWWSSQGDIRDVSGDDDGEWWNR